MIKKAMIFFFAMLMLLSGAVSAAAEPQTGIKCADVESFELQKAYALNDSRVKKPTGEISFKIEKLGVRASNQSVDTMPVFNAKEYSLSFAQRQENTKEMKASAQIPLPIYSDLGIYTYRITEKNENGKDASAKNRPVILTVMVTNCPEKDGDLDRSFYMEYEDAPGEKISYIYAEKSSDQNSEKDTQKATLQKSNVSKAGNAKTGDENHLLYLSSIILLCLLLLMLSLRIKTKGKEER